MHSTDINASRSRLELVQGIASAVLILFGLYLIITA